MGKVPEVRATTGKRWVVLRRVRSISRVSPRGEVELVALHADDDPHRVPGVVLERHRDLAPPGGERDRAVLGHHDPAQLLVDGPLDAGQVGVPLAGGAEVGRLGHQEALAEVARHRVGRPQDGAEGVEPVADGADLGRPRR